MPRFQFVGLDEDQEDPIGVKGLSYYPRSASFDLPAHVAGAFQTQLNPYVPATVRVRDIKEGWVRGDAVGPDAAGAAVSEFAVWTSPPSHAQAAQPPWHTKGPELTDSTDDGNLPMYLYGLLQVESETGATARVCASASGAV